MGTEIERKFLVRNDDWRTPEVLATGTHIVQGYFTASDGVRAKITYGKVPTMTITVRSDGEERTIQAPLSATAANHKRLRYNVDIDGNVIIMPGFEARVRVEDGKCTVALKHGTEPVRTEYEFDVEDHGIESLLAATTGHLIEKVRYRHDLGEGLVAEIDEYRTPAGRTVVEVETPAVDTTYEQPSYFGREVTGQKAYKNSHMALGDNGSAKSDSALSL